MEPADGIRGETFASQIAAGLGLDRLTLDQDSSPNLPLYIPTRTHELPKHIPIGFRWAGISARLLFNRNTLSPVEPRPYLSSAARTRRRIQVGSSTNLLAVLNGDDQVLEGFWGMKRKRFYHRLESCGFSTITGPTFSIYDEGPVHPASHNVCMLRRHHRVIQELKDTNLNPVPNLYWRNAADREKWIRWLASNSDVSTITRDFSLTKQLNRTFQEEFDGLLEIMEEVDRQLHVILVGVGPKKAAQAILSLAQCSSTCSVVTGDPVIRAISNGQALTHAGTAPPQSVPEPESSRSHLALRNTWVMERHLTETANELDLYASRIEEGHAHNLHFLEQKEELDGTPPPQGGAEL